METFFIQNDSILLRDFLVSKGYKLVTQYPNLTGIACRNSQELFFIGLDYGQHLSSLEKTKTVTS